MVLGNQKTRKKFKKFQKKFDGFIAQLFQMGVNIFAMLGFFMSMIVFMKMYGLGSGLPKVFGFWIGISLALVLIDIGIMIVHRNNKNWGGK